MSISPTESNVTLDRPQSQAGSTIEDRPRPASPFEIKYRPRSAEFLETTLIVDFHDPPASKAKSKARPGSVLAVTELFEKKAAQNQSVPLFPSTKAPPPVQLPSTSWCGPGKFLPANKHTPRFSSGSKPQIRAKSVVITTSMPSRSTPELYQNNTPSGADFHAEPHREVEKSISHIETRKRTSSITSLSSDSYHICLDMSQESSNYRVRTDIPSDAIEDTCWKTGVEAFSEGSSGLEGTTSITYFDIEEEKPPEDIQTPIQTVRGDLSKKTVSDAKIQGKAASVRFELPGQTEHSKSRSAIRGTGKQMKHPPSNRVRSRESSKTSPTQVLALKDDIALSSRRSTVPSISASSQHTDNVPQTDGQLDVIQNESVETLPTGFGPADGRSVDFLYRSTAIEELLSNTPSAQQDNGLEIPDHVDWRSGYGRRKTQDFGFPGARTRLD